IHMDEKRYAYGELSLKKDAVKPIDDIGPEYNLSFKMVRSESKLIKTSLYFTGLTQASARNPNFNILWTSTHLNSHCLRSLKSGSLCMAQSVASYASKRKVVASQSLSADRRAHEEGSFIRSSCLRCRDVLVPAYSVADNKKKKMTTTNEKSAVQEQRTIHNQLNKRYINNFSRPNKIMMRG
uniref:Uncharacterized protein n=1 Tax=Pristionchus pacificus TaxID=54126 RepID=A0A8R1UVZ5_PRIPA